MPERPIPGRITKHHPSGPTRQPISISRCPCLSGGHCAAGFGFPTETSVVPNNKGKRRHGRRPMYLRRDEDDQHSQNRAQCDFPDRQTPHIESDDGTGNQIDQEKKAELDEEEGVPFERGTTFFDNERNRVIGEYEGNGELHHADPERIHCRFHRWRTCDRSGCVGRHGYRWCD